MLKRLHSMLAVALFGLSACAVAQTDFPNRAVTIVVPFPPGGQSDNIGRWLGNGLSKKWNVPVIIENKGGAAGNIGAAYASRQPADGYTLLVSNTATHVINPNIYKNPGFDAKRDFEPVIMVIKSADAILVNNDVPAHSVAELIALTKARPGQINFGVPGYGSAGHFVGILFNNVAGINMNAVPYKGTPQVQADILNGNLQVVVDNVTTWTPLAEAGRLRMLAVTSRSRLANLPNIPTMQELGFKDFEATTFSGITVPRGTPKEVITKLNADIGAVIATDEFKAYIKGDVIVGGSPEDFGRVIDQDYAVWGKVARDIDLKAE